MFAMNHNQQGYILIECLVGLVILSTITLSLVHTLPIIIESQKQLDVEQTIYNKLYELHDQRQFYSQPFLDDVRFTTPVSYTVKQQEHQLCATYTWRQRHEKTICL